MVIKQMGKGRAVLAGFVAGIFSVLVSTFLIATPAHAASTVQVEWTSATTLKLSGNALEAPIEIVGSLTGNVLGTPAGSQTFVASTAGPANMSFSCKVSITVMVKPNAQGALDYSKGSLTFLASPPSNCSKEVLVANINGLVNPPFSSTSNLTLDNVAISGVDKRDAPDGNDATDKQFVNVTAGMGPASDNSDLPAKDTFTICEAKGNYVNDVNALYQDCLDQKASALATAPLTSNDLETFANGKGPRGADEKGWTGQFKDIKGGVYVVCSANFKTCKLFTKTPGEVADVYLIFGSTPGSVIPGNPPGQGQGTDQKVCTSGEGLAGALAWILCPAVQLIASAVNFFEKNIIIPFMTVSPLTTNENNPTYILWQNIRNLANIGFIIFFFIIIFSQATSVGLSNYGIKRVLPRMIFVVVGVNLSYFIAAFIIDAFNIFGAGIAQLVMSALQQANVTQLNSGTSSSAVQMFSLGGAALLTVILSAGAAIGWFFSFLGLMLLIVVIVVIVLVVRQAGIIVLAIVAPIPILFSLLPNTESIYRKWRELFVNLLVMYPGIVLLFAAGKILSVILVQPDLIATGENISDDVKKAIMVFLQAIVVALPLLLAPATYLTGNALTRGAYNLLNNSRARNMAQGGGKALNERFIKPRAKEAQMRAARRGGAVGFVAGYGARRDFKREQREREISRARNEYLSNETLRNEGFAASAAGIGGRAGVTRVQASAVNQQEKSRQEELANEGAILSAELRRLGISTKEFNTGFSNYVRGTDKNGNPAASEIVGTSGSSINFAERSDITRSALNAAASQGEIGTIEAARLNHGIDQSMVDDIIRNNDGKLKEKGGYHLATQFTLAADRMTKPRTDAAGNYVDASGSVVSDARLAAQDRITSPLEERTVMARQRLDGMAQSGPNDIAGMKAGLLVETAGMLKQVQSGPPAAGASQGEIDSYNVAVNAYNSLSSGSRQKLFDRLDEMVANTNTMAKVGDPDAIRDMHKFMSSGAGGSHKHSP